MKNNLNITRMLSILIASLCLVAQVMADDIDFNRDIRPILSDRCYYCHGPDPEHREADIRFDTSEGAEDAIDSGEFIDRVLSDDPDYLMPPPKSKLSLTESEKGLLEAWVKSGAQYDGHWAFQPLPQSVEVPKLKDGKASKANGEDASPVTDSGPLVPLDSFILAQLESKKIEPSPPAPPWQWLRRATFDLTGLPPTIDEIEEFESLVHSNSDSRSNSDSAYEQAVDRLLASSAFGEQMATGWLDAARYADSYGYQSDKLNTQWPYRDWVVRAFNENLPYDKFITWQLAGDLLENPTRDQRLATAFNRIHRLNNEGGAVYEEWRIENVADRVHTYGTAVLGLTMECCRCHDHKYDPIPAREYYSLGAFFNSIDESGVYDRTEKVPSPSLLLPTDAQSQVLADAKEKLKLAEAHFANVCMESNQRRERWIAENKDAPRSIPDLHLQLDFDQPYDESQKDVWYPATDDGNSTAPLAVVEVKGSTVRRPNSQQEGNDAAKEIPRSAIQLDGARGVTIKGVTPFDRWTPFSVVLSLRETKRTKQSSVLAHHTRGTDMGYNGWDLLIEAGYLESRLYRVWPGNALGVRTVEPIPKDRWSQVTATYDGSSTATGLKLFLDGKELTTTILRDEIVKSANVVVDHGGRLVVGQRFRSRGFAGGLVDDVQVFTRALSPPEIDYLATGESIKVTQDYFCSAIDEPSRQAANELTEARHQWVMAEETIIEIPIMRESDHPRDAHLLARGVYDAPTDENTKVQRVTFKEIGPAFPADAPKNRLGLAQWTTLPDHPLTSRVIVNRLWANFFGAGLVRTPENFGLQGDLPTHPKLFDWLARDFVDHGWDVKRFCKNIVLSKTYRQNSTVRANLQERDPENRLLARGPAYRLSAEQIRDLTLASTGLLNRQMGGPPVSPYQPGGDLWKESNTMSPSYQQSVGEALHRRSLYSVWKRTAPLPNMLAFDASSREVCTVARSRTNTPLQALVLLNDIQFVEAARVLADRLLLNEMETADAAETAAPDANQTKPDVKQSKRIQRAFQALTGRVADEKETKLLLELFQDELEYYRKNPGEAKKLIQLGETKVNEKSDPVALAAMTTVCQMILNLDATVWKR